MKMRFVPIALVSLAFAGLGCDGDDGTTPPEVIDIRGTWSYSSVDLVGGPITCQMTGITATLTQDGSSFAGTTQGGTVTCQSGEESGSQDLTPFTVTGGMISGSSLTFTIEDEGQAVSITHTGTVSGNTMSGNVTAQFELPPPYSFLVSLTGTWTATRG